MGIQIGNYFKLVLNSYLAISKLADESFFKNRSAQLCLRFVLFSAELEKEEDGDHG